jgi:hypothetical protein
VELYRALSLIENLFVFVKATAGAFGLAYQPQAPHPRLSIRLFRQLEGREAGSWIPAASPDLSVNRLARDRQLAVRVDWARRKPMLLLRLSALFLFRLDVRKFSGLLFQEPPRITRWPSLGPLPF